MPVPDDYKMSLQAVGMSCFDSYIFSLMRMKKIQFYFQPFIFSSNTKFYFSINLSIFNLLYLKKHADFTIVHVHMYEISIYTA